MRKSPQDPFQHRELEHEPLAWSHYGYTAPHTSPPYRIRSHLVNETPAVPLLRACCGVCFIPPKSVLWGVSSEQHTYGSPRDFAPRPPKADKSAGGQRPAPTSGEESRHPHPPRQKPQLLGFLRGRIVKRGTVGPAPDPSHARATSGRLPHRLRLPLGARGRGLAQARLPPLPAAFPNPPRFSSPGEVTSRPSSC